MSTIKGGQSPCLHQSVRYVSYQKQPRVQVAIRELVDIVTGIICCHGDLHRALYAYIPWLTSSVVSCSSYEGVRCDV